MQEADELSKFAALIQDIGYKADKSPGNTIYTKMSGFVVAVFYYHKFSIQMYFGVTIGETVPFSREGADKFNRENRFCKCYVTEEAVSFEQDFLFDIEDEAARNNLDKIFDVWESVMSLAKSAIDDEGKREGRENGA